MLVHCYKKNFDLCFMLELCDKASTTSTGVEKLAESLNTPKNVAKVNTCIWRRS